MPAETHVERGPLGPDEVLGLVRERLAEILEIEEGTITRDSTFAEDLGADSLALIELVEALEEDIGERTVETHLANIYAKFGVHSRMELLRFAAELQP